MGCFVGLWGILPPINMNGAPDDRMALLHALAPGRARADLERWHTEHGGILGNPDDARGTRGILKAVVKRTDHLYT